MSKRPKDRDQVGLLGYLSFNLLAVVGASVLSPAAGVAAASTGWLASLTSKMLDISGGVFGNMAAHHLENIQYKNWPEWFFQNVSDQPNHDLLKAFQSAVISALEDVKSQYSLQFPESNVYHIKSVNRKISDMQEAVESDDFLFEVEQFRGK
ncbi:MAG: hypothetical protein AAFP08_12755, partial [Bacteroidota bacterium]